MLPVTTDVTLTVITHSPGVAPICLGIVPPLKATDVPPATAVSGPPQVLLVVRGAETNKYAGKLFVKVAPVRSKPGLGLNNRIVIVETPPRGISIGLKLRLISAGIARTGVSENKSTRKTKIDIKKVRRYVFMVSPRSAQCANVSLIAAREWV
jgi:hypothetical protein